MTVRNHFTTAIKVWQRSFPESNQCDLFWSRIGGINVSRQTFHQNSISPESDICEWSSKSKIQFQFPSFSSIQSGKPAPSSIREEVVHSFGLVQCLLWCDVIPLTFRFSTLASSCRTLRRQTWLKMLWCEKHSSLFFSSSDDVTSFCKMFDWITSFGITFEEMWHFWRKRFASHFTLKWCS